jgi:hypothetical protein
MAVIISLLNYDFFIFFLHCHARPVGCERIRI